MQFKLSIDSAVAGNDLRRATSLARHLRAEGVLLTARSAALDLTSLSASGSREVRHLLASSEIELVGLRLVLGADGLSPRADLDAAVESVEQVLRAAAELGRAMVCVDLGPLPPAASSPAETRPRPTADQAGLILLPEPATAPPAAAPQPRDPAFESSVSAALRELGRSADRYGVVVAFSSSLASMASLQAAITSAACPWFGVDLDPLAMLADDEDRDAVFSQIGRLIRHVRLRDGVRGSGNRVRVVGLGDGQVDWGRMLTALDAAGYHGFLTVDVTDLNQPGPTVAAAALDRVRALLAR